MGLSTTLTLKILVPKGFLTFLEYKKGLKIPGVLQKWIFAKSKKIDIFLTRFVTNFDCCDDVLVKKLEKILQVSKCLRCFLYNHERKRKILGYLARKDKKISS